MPTYYFDIYNGEAAPDLTGTELGNVQEARVMAVRFLGQVLLEKADVIERNSCWRVEVSREDRQLLFSVTLAVEDRPVS
ncbi:DUF6894 family protein [Novosphingobium panipatense]|uniref:DUF6894 domain-containing protein n=1 Tax=Novosphingobium panipatense TaxID=428991 RepID=A0ABY1QIB3_9SPHN|nr:hypothetical protein [Novosphingobium panipatense]SMP72259.1 hypothetical protein SAMN06296065_106172 [Novosphingobium panipatense]